MVWLVLMYEKSTEQEMNEDHSGDGQDTHTQTSVADVFKFENNNKSLQSKTYFEQSPMPQCNIIISGYWFSGILFEESYFSVLIYDNYKLNRIKSFNRISSVCKINKNIFRLEFGLNVLMYRKIVKCTYFFTTHLYSIYNLLIGLY